MRVLSAVACIFIVSTTLAQDTTPPSISVTAGGVSSGSTIRSSPVTFTFTVSEPVTTFSRSNINPLVNCFSSSFSVISSTQYQLVCSPPANSVTEIGVGVPPGSFRDPAGNGNVGFNYYFVIVDNRPPEVSSITHQRSFESCGIGNTADISNRNPLVLNIATTEGTSDLTLGDLQLTNCVSPSFTRNSPTSYSLSCVTTGFDNVPVTVTVPSGSFSDAIGNLNTQTFSKTVVSDLVTPVLQISSPGHVAFDVVFDDPIIFTFTISEISDFNINDITTLENCLNPVFSGSGTQFTLRCSQNPNKLVAVGVGSNDIIDCAGNKNQVGVTYFGFFSQLPPSDSPSPSFLPSGVSRSSTPSRTASPSPSPSAFCTKHSYVGPYPDTYLSKCLDATCTGFSNLDAALEECSRNQFCGGVTLSRWSEVDFGQTLNPAQFQPRLFSTLVPSSDEEQSWVRLGCSATIEVTPPSNTTGPGQVYCYEGPFPDTYLPECVDSLCTSFATMDEAVDYCNSISDCAGITETSWGPADGSKPYQPRLYPVLTQSPFGEVSFLRNVCSL